MSSDLNRTILIGRLTKDPELRHTQSGTAVASFSLAVNYTYGLGENKKEQVSFINCVAWSKLGEIIIQYCKKGQRIAVDGRLQQRSWESQEGKKMSTVEVVVENFQFLTPKIESGNISDMGSQAESAPDMTDNNPFDDDDVFF